MSEVTQQKPTSLQAQAVELGNRATRKDGSGGSAGWLTL